MPKRLAACCVLLAGCTNAPNALELRVSPDKKEFPHGDPVLLNATLTATGGSVCLANSYAFAVELDPADGSASLQGSDQRFGCGTALMGILPIYPIILPVALLDLGDASGRFTVISHGQQKTRRLALGRFGSGLEVCSAREFHRRKEAGTVKTLPPGEYGVRVRLINEHVGGFPPPFFWKPYEHPVTADTRLVIKRAAVPTTRKE